jgi:molybdopterin converting factor small subunit
MQIRVLFFGATADTVGTRKVDYLLNGPTDAKEAIAKIIEKFPQLQNHKLLFAVNREYVSGGEIIRDGDELAIFTAVSGG